MAFSKGRFGVLYHPRGSEEKHLLRWVVVVVLLVLVAFVCYKVSKSLARGSDASEETPIKIKGGRSEAPARATPPAAPSKPASAGAQTPPARPDAAAKPRADNAGKKTPSATAQPVRPTAAEPDAARKPVDGKPPAEKPAAQLPPAARALIEKIRETMADRPNMERVLLEKLVSAEQQGNTIIAADTIQKLVRRPAVGDLSDLFMRRLGELNMQRLFSGKPSPWTTMVTVRRGDGRERIAREYRTTPAAVARLNPDVKWEKLKPGDSVRVLNFPSATLVVHKSGYADLSLNRNEAFFRRYYLSVSKSAKSGLYPIESGNSVGARFRELGIKLAAPDRAELEMFLPTGSRIVVYQEQ